MGKNDCYVVGGLMMGRKRERHRNLDRKKFIQCVACVYYRPCVYIRGENNRRDKRKETLEWFGEGCR